MLFILLFASVLLFIIYLTSKNPFYGLLFMIGVNPIEALLPWQGIISFGRIVGVITILAWILYLQKHQVYRSRLLQSRLNMFIWLFPFVCLIGVIINGNQSEKGYTFVFKVFLMAIMSIMLENLIDTKQKLFQLFVVLTLSSLIASVFPVASFYDIDLYTRFGLDPIERNLGGRSAGLTNNANSLGSSASIGLFSILILSIVKSQNWLKILNLSAGMIMILTLFLSGSRTHIIAVFIFSFILTILYLMSGKSNIFSILLTVIIISITSFVAYQSVPENIQKRLIISGKYVDASTINRKEFSIDQKNKALRIIYSNPLFGVGLNGFSAVKDNKVYGFDVHDTVSLLLGETGLLGSLSFLLLSITCWQWLYRAMILAKHINIEIYYYLCGFISSYITIFILGWGAYIMIYERWFWIMVGISPIIHQLAIVGKIRHLKPII